ncbi:lysophospholipase L1-like esterase [Geodermatophilus bullaregiensis]|uniref:SGNH/GDSL hydrolase family protein n=1 Tax=Geodermatophilus bullaregiensis TaxID=1564160 RepID=UPI00195E322F|nr:SGNH/GDSL hydrolase family protein [Geodermatophilus bullaregiensis]MBM7805818.1 lysophospholipase L1-like esterase [Geodermatophilus bullaregiensis]
MAAPVSRLAGLLVSCLAACLALAACGGTDSAEGPTTPATPPTTTTAGTTPPAAPAEEVRAVFLGDSYTVGVGSDGPTYAAQVADRLGWTQVEAAQSGTGYVSDGGGGDNAPFGGRVDDVVAADPDVVVVQGSTNDVGVDPAAVGAAAAALYAELAAAVPDADVVVLGPLAAPVVPRAAVEAVRDALAAAAGQAGVRFVDPIADGWLEPPDGLYADGLHPDEDGYARLADELAEDLRAAGW